MPLNPNKLLVTLFCLLPVLAMAQVSEVQNKWKGTYLQTQNGQLIDGKAPGAGTAWVIEGIQGQPDFVRLRSASDGTYLHIEHGPLQAGNIEPGWWSAMWAIDPVDNQYVRLRNRWKPNLYINNETGPPRVSEIQPGWWSAMWAIVPAAQAQSVYPDPRAASGQRYDSSAPATAASPGALPASATEVTLFIENFSNAALDIFVDNPNGEPGYVATLQPGQVAQQPSPVGRMWLLAQNDQWVGSVTASNEPQQLIRFP